MDLLTKYLNFGYFRFIAETHQPAVFHIAYRNPKSTNISFLRPLMIGAGALKRGDV
jgi:hypothetical protein